MALGGWPGGPTAPVSSRRQQNRLLGGRQRPCPLYFCTKPELDCGQHRPPTSPRGNTGLPDPRPSGRVPQVVLSNLTLPVFLFLVLFFFLFKSSARWGSLGLKKVSSGLAGIKQPTRARRGRWARRALPDTHLGGCAHTGPRNFSFACSDHAARQRPQVIRSTSRPARTESPRIRPTRAPGAPTAAGGSPRVLPAESWALARHPAPVRAQHLSGLRPDPGSFRAPRPQAHAPRAPPRSPPCSRGRLGPRPRSPRPGPSTHPGPSVGAGFAPAPGAAAAAVTAAAASEARRGGDPRRGPAPDPPPGQTRPAPARPEALPSPARPSPSPSPNPGTAPGHPPPAAPIPCLAAHRDPWPGTLPSRRAPHPRSEGGAPGTLHVRTRPLGPALCVCLSCWGGKGTRWAEVRMSRGSSLLRRGVLQEPRGGGTEPPKVWRRMGTHQAGRPRKVQPAPRPLVPPPPPAAPGAFSSPGRCPGASESPGWTCVDLVVALQTPSPVGQRSD